MKKNKSREYWTHSKIYKKSVPSKVNIQMKSDNSDTSVKRNKVMRDCLSCTENIKIEKIIQMRTSQKTVKLKVRPLIHIVIS